MSNTGWDAEAVMDSAWGPLVAPPEPYSDCPHKRTQLMYVGVALDEYWCLDCPAKIRVWNSSP